MLRYAKRAAEATVETVKLGAQSLATRDRLVAFAGGAQRADEMIEALIASSDYGIDRLQAMTLSSRLLEQGLISTTAEMQIAGAMIVKLGDQTWSVERRMKSFNLMLANRSTRRLDDYGLSIERTKARAKELEKQGLSLQQAFKTAVFEQASEKLEILGDTSETAQAQIARFEASWRGLVQATAESLADLVTGGKALQWITQQFEAIEERTRLINEGLAKARELGVAPRRYAQAYMEAAQAAKVWQGDEEELRRAIEEKNVAVAEWDREAAIARVVAGRAALQAEFDRQDKIDALLEQAAQKRLAIHRSYEASATEIAQAGHRARLDALDSALQAELEALDKAIEERNFLQRLADMEQRHQDRIASIRARAIETERQIEDRRHRELMARLAEEQKARLRALRAQFGKDDSAADQRETLEEEHRRRMMGLYTESARDRERKRHEEAIAELAFQEAEAALLEQFEAEKKAAERAHTEELGRIKEREIQAAIQAEEQRYQNEVRLANERRAQQQADQQARMAIEQQFAAQQAQLERELALEIAEINRQAHAAELIAMETWLADMLAKLDHFKNESSRHFEANPLVIPVMLGPQVPEGWFPTVDINFPGFARGGVSRGGLAVVGERGPELLNLPRGTGITPMSGVGGGINVTNYFGAGSVRSDRDIRAIAEAQEQSLRLRGLGVVN
jgi:hypothetical protein